MNDLVKERDAHERESSSLRKQMQDAQQEMNNMRQNLSQSKQESENRINAERQQRDAARVQLEARLEEMRKKKSKYNVRLINGPKTHPDDFHSVSDLLALYMGLWGNLQWVQSS